MYRRICALLVVTILATMIPVQYAFASSSNRVNKTITVKDGNPVKGVYLLLEPDNEVTSDSSIVIEFTNCKLVSQEVIDGLASEIEPGYEAGGYQWHEDRYYETGDVHLNDNGFLVPELAVKTYTWVSACEAGFDEVMTDSETGDLPYELRRTGNRELEVKLFPIPANRINMNTSSGTKIRYKIPIPVIADGEGTITAKINANSTTISESQFDIATVTKKKGDTTISIDEVNTGVDSIALDIITVKEDVAGTFDLSKLVKLRLSSGFVFDTSHLLNVSPGINCDFRSFSVTPHDDEIEFYWPADFTYTGSDEKAASIKFTGLVVLPEDDDTDWGQVSITISGGGCTKETILCGERTDYGFKYSANSTKLMNGRRQDGSFDDELFQSGEITLEETAPGSYIPQRKLQFTVPEGVHIFGIELVDCDEVYINSLSIGDGYCSLNDDGDKLNIENLPMSEDEISSFTFILYLTADASYTGDVPLHVSGGGINDNDLEDVIIANFTRPFSVTAGSTVGSVGKIWNATSDIVIKETKEMAFLEDGVVYIAIDSLFGGGELGLCDQGEKNITVEVTEGDLRLKNIKSDEGYIRFVIDRESSETPSTITISNVAVGTTRAVPYGSFGLKVYGSGIINNFSEDSDRLGKYGWSCDTKKYTVPNYFVIEELPEGEEAATLDVVRVIIDSTEMYVNNDKYDVGVAPYIQVQSASTLVPLRFISVVLSGDKTTADKADESNRVSWDNVNKIATIYVGQGNTQKIVQFKAGSDMMTINGTNIAMDNNVKAEIKDGRMFVPFRALGNALGVSVSWNEQLRMATYNDDGSVWPPVDENASEESTESTTENVTEESTNKTVDKTIDSSSNIRVYINKETKEFHLFGCPEMGQATAVMRNDALENGYSPCPTCGAGD